MQLYSEMTAREAVLHRALDRIAEGADPTLRPGHPDFMSKTAIAVTALRAIRDFNALNASVEA